MIWCRAERCNVFLISPRYSCHFTFSQFIWIRLTLYWCGVVHACVLSCLSTYTVCVLLGYCISVCMKQMKLTLPFHLLWSYVNIQIWQKSFIECDVFTTVTLWYYFSSHCLFLFFLFSPNLYRKTRRTHLWAAKQMIRRRRTELTSDWHRWIYRSLKPDRVCVSVIV